jgi:MYXO-CTERM domain-containing protein
MRSPIVLLSLSLSMAILGVAAPALATPGFPDAIKIDLALTYAPPCTVCHNNPGGGTGTVTQAFGVALRADGLAAYDAASLKKALTASETAKTDSDCDKVSDIAQLKEGRDPTTGKYIDGSGKPAPAAATCGGNTPTPETPEYGCGAHITATSSASAWQSALAVAALLGLGVFRRRRG